MVPVWDSSSEMDTRQGVETGLALLGEVDAEWGGLTLEYGQEGLRS
jgi:hypothetical protein